MSALDIWWLTIIFASPFFAFAVGKRIHVALSTRAKMAWGLGASVILMLAFTPLSLPGMVTDHILLGLAYAILWLMVFITPPTIRYGAVGIFAGLVFALYLLRWPVFVLLLILGDATRKPSQTIQLGCQDEVRMVGYGWVAHSGTEVVVSTRPLGLPLEWELGRYRFDDNEYDPAEISARTIGEESDCRVSVTYEGREIWQAY